MARDPERHRIIHLPTLPVPSDEMRVEPLERTSRRSLAERVAVRLRREIPLLVLDLAIVLVGYLATLVLRFDGGVPTRYWAQFWSILPVLMLVHLLANYLFGLYGQMWRYASVQEARRVLVAGVSSGLMVTAIGTLLLGARPLPLSVLGLGSILSLLGFGAIRFQSRLFALKRGAAMRERRRVLVVGAGEAGATLVGSLLRNPSFALDPIGFVDDDPRKVGLAIHGATVMGRLWEIPDLVARHEVDQVLLAIPSATSGLVRDVAASCERAEVVMRVLPSIGETVNGRITARDIRDLRIEDLLGRQQVTTDLAAVGRILTGRRVLVTGAGGSIGSEIARQVMTFEPSSLILLDHDETHLHDILTELDSAERVRGVLADVRDRERIFAIFHRHEPDVIFHAAAHKHVPVLEEYPEEALRTNIIGTANVADAANAAHVSQFVLISTDKAVRPESVMGASKWFAEQMIWSSGGNGCRFSAVRFGNVLGSRGSVIPTFLRQIGQGGPVTVTDAAMTRYFMSVQEAVQLVLQSAALSKGGEILTLDMGEPVNILELAREVIRLSGRVPGKDIEIRIVGRRPGEKLFEHITNADEEQIPSEHPAVLTSRPRLPDKASLRHAVRALEELASKGAAQELRSTIVLFANDTPQPIPQEVLL